MQPAGDKILQPQPFTVTVTHQATEIDHPVTAAYFKVDGDWIAFKGIEHEIVYYVRADRVLSITREAQAA